jgi:hypothetical protein
MDLHKKRFKTSFPPPIGHETLLSLSQGGFVGTLQILPESVPFSILLDGTVIVKSSADLDRETVGNFLFQVRHSET